DLKAFYQEGTLVVHLGQVGTIGSPDPEYKQSVFQPFAIQSNKNFYENYTTLRDAYLELSAKEIAEVPISDVDREQFNSSYERFVSQYGLLNSNDNRRRILEDAAFGVIILSSLE